MQNAEMSLDGVQWTNPMGASQDASPRSSAFEEESEPPSAFEEESEVSHERADVALIKKYLAPESFEVGLEGGARSGRGNLLDAWRETLVRHVIQGADENQRDLNKRMADDALARSSVISPSGSFRQKWDLIGIWLLAYVAFGVPYRLCFSHPVVLWSWWFWLDAGVDIYFLADIYVSLRTAFYTERGEIVVDEKTIRKEYLRTWFPIDAAACFPGNYVSRLTTRH